MNLQRGLWPETLVAALATLSVGWPLTTLLQEQSWLLNAVVAVALIALTGGILRSLRVPPSLIVASQLVVGVLTLCGMYLGGTLWLIFPTANSVTLAVELFAEAGDVLREFAAPAPTTTGVAFLVVAVLVLTAVSVDALALTCSAPAIAGLPLVAAFFVSVSNNGNAMAPWFFLLTAALWMTMMAQQSDRLLARWSSADNHGFGARPRFGGTYRALAQTLGVLGLCVAVATAALLPHLPPTFFADGLGRNSEANGRNTGAGQVSFTETMDPGKDLANQSESPVLEYTSTARLAQPLRVTATQEFDGQTWVAPDRDGISITGPELPATPGVSPEFGSSEEISVTVNNLRAPHLAIPSTTTSLSLNEPSFDYDPRVNTVLVDSPVDDYVALYADPSADGPINPAGPNAEGIGSATPELLEVPAQSQPAITALAAQILGGESDPLEVGRLTQEHFRSSDYTYSLTLAPRDETVSRDPITQFLASQQGYCVQFSTAMVMIARSEGIPARMAVGFLPGEVQNDGSRTVRAKDAHTWPELYINGLGWTRFEPTPGVRTGAPPALTQPDAASTAPAEVPELPTEQATPTAAPDTSSASDTSWWQSVTDWIVKWRWVWAGLLTFGVALCALPLAGRWYRGREAREAHSPTEHVESQWLVLTRSLTDLGVDEPGHKSPAAMQAHYTNCTSLDPPGARALGRVTAQLQNTRYADQHVLNIDESEVTSDVLTVVETVRAHSPWSVRTKAALLPRSGALGLAHWLRRHTSRD